MIGIPCIAELIRQTACGEVVYNDDTTVKILELMGAQARAAAMAELAEAGSDQKGRARTGLFTSGVVSACPWATGEDQPLPQ